MCDFLYKRDEMAVFKKKILLTATSKCHLVVSPRRFHAIFFTVKASRCINIVTVLLIFAV